VLVKEINKAFFNFISGLNYRPMQPWPIVYISYKLCYSLQKALLKYFVNTCVEFIVTWTSRETKLLHWSLVLPCWKASRAESFAINYSTM